MTVALDTGGAEAARPWVEAAAPSHPSLVDESHVVDGMFGVVNVPNGVWIDEDGVVVRPAEPASPERSPLADRFASIDVDSLPDEMREVFQLVRRIRREPPGKYVAALRDWIEHGRDSRYALPPDEVIRRSTPRPPEVAEAAAAFELGQHLCRMGFDEDADVWFERAQRLQPDNWTYKRDPWNRVAPGSQENWVEHVKAIGPENYYPPLDM